MNFLLETLQDADVDMARLADLEWQLGPFEPAGGFQPRALLRRLAGDPQFFVEILSYVYRGRHDEPRTDMSEAEETRAKRAYDLLRAFETTSGLGSGGTLAFESLRAWVTQARQLAEDVDRIEIADSHIGQLLASSTGGADGAWPHEAVRAVMEDVATDEIDDGFVVGTFNSRDVFWKSIGDGGAQERALATRYRGNAQKLMVGYPRVAAVLRRIAGQYDADALRADSQSQLELH